VSTPGGRPQTWLSSAAAVAKVPEFDPAKVDDLDLDEDEINIFGGAIALVVPFDMTGARITNTLLNNLREQDKTFGVETMCVGGSQGMTMMHERLSPLTVTASQ